MSEHTNPAGSEEPTTSGTPASSAPAFPTPDFPSPAPPSPAAPDATVPMAFAAAPAAPPLPPDGPSPQPSKARRRAGAVALVAGGVLAGGILATTLSAVADSDTGSGSSTQSPSDTRPTAPDGTIDESQPQRSDEELLTGDVAASVEAAALEAYPGATILRVESDSDGVYEAHLVTADGERVTVEVGEDFTVTGEEAMGPGGPGGPGGHGPRGGADGGTRTAPNGGLSTPDDGGTDDGGTDDGATTTPSSTT